MIHFFILPLFLIANSSAFTFVDKIPGPKEAPIQQKMITASADGPTMEGDILVDPFDYQKALKGTITRFKMSRWKKLGEMIPVPFVIDPKIKNKEDIYQAFDDYHQKTIIRFIPRTTERDYIYIKDNGEEGDCNSFIGRRGGRQKINFPTWCKKGGMIHELGHALGLFHEHTRPDRNRYIQIIWSNIVKKQWPNFIKVPWARQVGSFDFNSIMLYPSYNGFAKNKKYPTMLKRDGSTFLGQRNELAKGDIEAIALLYSK